MERLEPTSWASTLDAAVVAPNDPLRAAKWYVQLRLSTSVDSAALPIALC